MKNTQHVRISLDCSAEDRKLIKALASLENMTISEYLLSLAKVQMAEFSSWRHAHSKMQASNKQDDSDEFMKSLEGIA